MSSPGLQNRSMSSPDLQDRSMSSPGLQDRSMSSPGLHTEDRSMSSPGLHGETDDPCLVRVSTELFCLMRLSTTVEMLTPVKKHHTAWNFFFFFFNLAKASYIGTLNFPGDFSEFSTLHIEFAFHLLNHCGSRVTYPWISYCRTCM
jgi:hypothetical protein